MSRPRFGTTATSTAPRSYDARDFFNRARSSSRPVVTNKSQRDKFPAQASHELIDQIRVVGVQVHRGAQPRRSRTLLRRADQRRQTTALAVSPVR